jgi:hypothetical protein
MAIDAIGVLWQGSKNDDVSDRIVEEGERTQLR